MKIEKKLPPAFGRFVRPGRFLDKQPSSAKAPPQKKPEALKQSPATPPAAALLILLLLSLVFGSMAEAATFGRFETSTPSGVYTNRLLWNLAASTSTNRIFFTNSSSAFGDTNTSAFNIKSNSSAGRWEWRSGTTVLATNAVNRPYATWLTNGVGAGIYGYTRYEPSTIYGLQLDALNVVTDPTNFFNANASSFPSGSGGVDAATVAAIMLTNNSGTASLATNANGLTFQQQAITNTTFSGSFLTGQPFGEYGWSFTNTVPIRVFALGKWKTGNMTNTIDVQLRSTNQLGNCVLVAQTRLNMSQFTSNQYCYAELPFPVTLQPGTVYAITYLLGSGDTDGLYAASTLNPQSVIKPIRGISNGTDCYGFSGWVGQGLGMVNFKYELGAEPVNTFAAERVNPGSGIYTEQQYVKSVSGTEYPLNLSSAFNEKPVDVGGLLKKPLRSISPFLDLGGTFENEGYVTNVLMGMRTNGCLAAGWDTYELTDGWNHAGRATDGTLAWNTTNFSKGLPWLTARAHEYGFKMFTYFGWNTNTCLGVPGSPYWPTVYNQNQLSNDCINAVRWGFDGLFYDNSCPAPLATFEGVTKVTRIVNDASTTGRLQYQGTNFNRGLIFRMTLNAFGNQLTNAIFPYELNDSVNVLTINGDENSTASPIGGEQTFYLKTKQSFQYPWFTRRGHYFDVQAFNQNLSSNVTRILFNSYVMGPMCVIINPNCTNNSLYLLTNQQFYAWYDDPAAIPGRAVGTNGYRCEIWRRPIGIENGLTNLISFINASNNTVVLNFTNSMVGYPGSEIVFKDIWTGTNVMRTTNGTLSYTLTASNCVTFVTYPEAAETVHWGPHTMNVTGTGTSEYSVLSGGSTPHFISAGWQQTAANNVMQMQWAIEPEVSKVRIKYYWYSTFAGSVFWTDTWTTYFNTTDLRGGGVNFTTNIITSAANNIKEIIMDVQMPYTNCWKQLNFTGGASTNTSGRVMPFGWVVTKWR